MSTTINGDNVNVPGTVTTAGLKVTGGTPGAGKVLVGDGVGNVVWTSLTISGFVSGYHAIANGVDGEIVTGLGLSAIPTGGILTIRKPAGGLNLAASIVAGSLSTDGFEYTLTGVTDSANYVLDYILIP